MTQALFRHCRKAIAESLTYQAKTLISLEADDEI
jgi:hypothetical protein